MKWLDGQTGLGLLSWLNHTDVLAEGRLGPVTQ